MTCDKLRFSLGFKLPIDHNYPYFTDSVYIPVNFKILIDHNYLYFTDSMYIFDRKARVHEVWDHVIHELYNKPKKYANDIALIIIHDTFVFGPKAQRVVLSKSVRWMSENETGFVATGWGLSEV